MKITEFTQVIFIFRNKKHLHWIINISINIVWHQTSKIRLNRIVKRIDQNDIYKNSFCITTVDWCRIIAYVYYNIVEFFIWIYLCAWIKCVIFVLNCKEAVINSGHKMKIIRYNKPSTKWCRIYKSNTEE